MISLFILGTGNSFPYKDIYSYYKFEETSGIPVDSIGNTSFDERASIGYEKDGINNKCFEFNNSTSYIYINNNNVFSFERDEKISYSLWIKRKSINTESRMFTKTAGTPSLRGYSLIILSGNSLQFTYSYGIDSSNYFQLKTNDNTFNDLDTWVHIVVTYDGSSNANGVNIYKNGTKLSTNIIYNDLSSSIISVGGLSLCRFADLYLDEFGIWKTDLSENMVKSLNNNGIGRFY